MMEKNEQESAPSKRLSRDSWRLIFLGYEIDREFFFKHFNFLLFSIRGIFLVDQSKTAKRDLLRSDFREDYKNGCRNGNFYE